MSFAPEDRLVLARGVRVRFDPVRNCHVLLAPERVLFPCPTSVEILGRLGEPRSFGALVAELAAEFDAPAEEIGRDLEALLSDLVAQRVVRVERRAA
ncbi:MAG: pyrroloquinoline quinone biosynthesis peptide chaperone PqqD [Geminicoccaceae bacterium]|nr:pyrroloquinoline quinone biosynthesis peptide chaperone PqqD [Geminicoccaceae bacterium]